MLEDNTILREGVLVCQDPVGDIIISSRDLCQMSRKIYEAILTLPKEKLHEIDLCIIDWLKVELPRAEQQLKLTEGLTFKTMKDLILTIKCVLALLMENKCIEVVNEFGKYIIFNERENG